VAADDAPSRHARTPSSLPPGATTTITVNDAADPTTGTNCTPGSEAVYSFRAASVAAAVAP
jgi:hypothetical protein